MALGSTIGAGGRPAEASLMAGSRSLLATGPLDILSLKRQDDAAKRSHERARGERDIPERRADRAALSKRHLSSARPNSVFASSRHTCRRALSRREPPCA